jgi:hypothetical protein
MAAAENHPLPATPPGMMCHNVVVGEWHRRWSKLTFSALLRTLDIRASQMLCNLDERVTRVAIPDSRVGADEVDVSRR